MIFVFDTYIFIDIHNIRYTYTYIYVCVCVLVCARACESGVVDPGKWSPNGRNDLVLRGYMMGLK